MILYYGTNIDFSEIHLSKCRPNKDFGCGFYLTDILSQARAMAVRRCDWEETGSPVVQVYDFDEALLCSGEFRVKVFEKVSVEWANFIMLNRSANGKMMHNYDIVVGPVADDGVVFQLNLYAQHLISIENLAEALTYRQLNSQYYFGTERAVQQLHRIWN
ncbi:MAG: DUF3990 domain-containing protein [Bacteroidales bacterium]|nr:DUF3990 domain-containing protein [Bacteroidales bacterium]